MTGLPSCGGNVAAAGRLLSQQQRQATAAALAVATRHAAADEARWEEHEAAQEALECQLCMGGAQDPQLHAVQPPLRVRAMRGERVMRFDKRCPYCWGRAESIKRVSRI